MPFGQLVIGPPGSGKTTYCNGMHQYLTALGRKVAIINLDPANDLLPYTAAVDVSELVCLETVMDELKLGPNGGELLAYLVVDYNLDNCYISYSTCSMSFSSIVLLSVVTTNRSARL